MASYQAPGASLVALIEKQIDGLPDEVLSKEARRCLVGYARHLGRKGLARDGDHLVAGLLLNALEMALYVPTGKAGKGSLELTRLQERIERTQTAARRAEKRKRKAKDGRGALGVLVPPPARPYAKQNGNQEQAGESPADVEGQQAADAAGGSDGG